MPAVAAPPAPVETGPAPAPVALPYRILTHKDLPETDGSVPTNFAENPQSSLLNDTMAPVLARVYPDGQFAVGNDSFIYWRQTPHPTDGAKAPDWFVVPGIPPMLDGEPRRSYLQYTEGIRPFIVIEYVSGTGEEEHDTTPLRGKFWVYEQGIGATYYAIQDGFRGTLELWRRNGTGYHRVEANEQGRLPLSEWGVELGLWPGTLNGTTAWYVRPWDRATGQMLPSFAERAEVAEGLVDDFRQEAQEATEQLSKERQAAREAAEALAAEQRRTADLEREADSERQRAADLEREADLERQRAADAAREADLERRRAADSQRAADVADARAARLAELLRQAGIDPGAA